MPWICHKTLNKLFHDFPKPNKYYGKFLLIDALWNDPTNYRPISLLSCVGKVFERVIFKYIYNFLIDNSLIYKYQSGFMHNYSRFPHMWESTSL
jgi:hypothetical protein